MEPCSGRKKEGDMPVWWSVDRYLHCPPVEILFSASSLGGVETTVRQVGRNGRTSEGVREIPAPYDEQHKISPRPAGAIGVMVYLVVLR